MVTKTRDIYKGEGTIQFTCYFPFGYSKEKTPEWLNDTDDIMEINQEIDIGGDLPTTFVFNGNGIGTINGIMTIGDLSICPSSSGFIWDSKTGLVLDTDGKTPIRYTGTSYGTIGPKKISVNFNILPHSSATLKYRELFY